MLGAASASTGRGMNRRRESRQAALGWKTEKCKGRALNEGYGAVCVAGGRATAGSGRRAGSTERAAPLPSRTRPIQALRREE